MPEGSRLVGMMSWIGQAVLRAVIMVGVGGVAVWAVGDRLLTHALSGFEKALDITNSKIDDVSERLDGLGEKIDKKGTEAVDRFFQAIQDNKTLEVNVTGNFERISQEMRATNQRLDNLIVQVNNTTTELSTLGKSVEANTALQQELLRGLIKQ
jgi:tetrahydromethanopterin S-methyltransferase subunit G